MSHKVSVIGTGRMGSALARTLFTKGFATTVWNRTPSRAEPLARLGLRVAPTLAAAVQASDILICIVSDYAAAQRLLQEQDVLASLPGKTLVQLTTGTPQEARQMEAWARQHGIAYLDGAIMSYPSGIGAAECTIFYSGAKEVFDGVHPVLMALGGNTSLLGGAIGHASALDMAGLQFVLGAMFGFVQGYVVCKEEGLPSDAFAGSVKSLLPALEEILRVISSNIERQDYAGDEATIEAWSVGPRELLAWCKDRGMSAGGIGRAQHQLFEQALQAGRSQADFAYFYELMRKAEN